MTIQARLNNFVPLIVTLFSGQFDENSKLGRLFFVDHNAKMNTAMYKMVLQKHLKASMKMTGTEVFMQEGAPCHMARSITTWLKDEANFPVLS